jgi:hypothetical protein
VNTCEREREQKPKIIPIKNRQRLFDKTTSQIMCVRAQCVCVYTCAHAVCVCALYVSRMCVRVVQPQNSQMASLFVNAGC